VDQELVYTMVNYAASEVIHICFFTPLASLSSGFDVLGNQSIAHGEYLTLRYPQDKQWQYAPELNVPRARPLVLIVPDNSIRGQSVYAAGGFNVNPNTHKPFIVPDLQLFNQSTQRWQRVTTIPNLELSHALSFNDNKLHVSETIEVPDQLPVTNMLRSFDLQKLIWTNSKNNIDDRKINDQNSMKTIPSKSPLIASPDIKNNRNVQVIYFI
jgi:hypothetical protein